MADGYPGRHARKQPYRARRLWRLRRLLRAAVLLGGRGGGRLPEAVAGAPRPVAGAPPRFDLRFFRGTLRRGARLMNPPNPLITSTPSVKNPETPAPLPPRAPQAG